MIINLIAWLIFGALAGWIASVLMKSDGQMGTVANVIVGILGAMVGGWLMSAFGQAGVTGFNVYSFFVAVVGAVVLLFVIGILRRATY